jgi:hypothetical protein
MVAHITPILNLEVFYYYCLLFFYHVSDVTCVHTMQILVVFKCSEMRPEVVLAARWRRRVNLKSPIDSRLRFSISVPLTFIVYRSPRLCVLGDFYRCKLRPEVVLAARWRRRANLKSLSDSPTMICY